MLGTLLQPRTHGATFHAIVRATVFTACPSCETATRKTAGVEQDSPAILRAIDCVQQFKGVETRLRLNVCQWH